MHSVIPEAALKLVRLTVRVHGHLYVECCHMAVERDLFGGDSVGLV